MNEEQVSTSVGARSKHRFVSESCQCAVYPLQIIDAIVIRFQGARMTVRRVTEAEIRSMIDQARWFLGRCEWPDPDFSLEKAAFGAILAEIAYCAISPEERQEAARAKILVPSEIFRSIVAGGVDFDLADFARSADLPIEVVSTPGFTAVLLSNSTDVFIGVRGTQFAYDWAIDLDAAKWALRDDDAYFAHRGFYMENVLLSSKLYRRLSREHRTGDDQTIRVHVFGHSLGGAICALLSLFEIQAQNTLSYDAIKVHDCYTYGAPRSVSQRLSVILRSYAIRRPGDIVPLAPLELQGYADYLEQYGCNGHDWRARGIASEPKRLWRRVADKANSLNPLTQHMIEGYKAEIIGALPPSIQQPSHS